MSRFMDFDAAMAEEQGEPLTFKLGGEMFTACAELPGGVLLALARSMGEGDDSATFALFTEFFEAIVAPEDTERFLKTTRRVGFGKLQRLLQWIVEESTGRPFEMPSSSQPRLVTDGGSSKDDSLSWAAEARSA